MNLNERVLSVLGCRFVDDVLLDAPWEVTQEMIASFNISVVAHGSSSDCTPVTAAGSNGREDRHRIAKQLGIYKEVDSTFDLSVPQIVGRVLAHQERHEQRYRTKSRKEAEYYRQRFGLQPGGPTEPSDAGAGGGEGALKA